MSQRLQNVTDGGGSDRGPVKSAAPDGQRQTPPRRGRDKSLLWQRVLLRFVTLVTPPLRRLPRPAALRVGNTIGWIAYHAAGRARRTARRNLRLAYGDPAASETGMTRAEREALVWRVFAHFGKVIVDFLRTSDHGGDSLSELISGCEGWQEYVAPLVAQGRPFILFGGHFGNWELVGHWLATQPGVRFTAVAREPKDEGFARWVRSTREGAGFAVANKGDQARRLLSALKRGGGLGVLIDQNSGDLFVPFFGVPAGTVAGPALLARRTGAALIPTYCVREPDDTYRLVFLPPLRTSPESDDTEAEDARVMAEANRVLEAVIRRHPDQWLWLHDRWKSAFEEKNRPRWPQGFDFDAIHARWKDR